jgi:uncharacterized membrane protein YvbJ
MHCAFCGSPNDDQSQFCFKCGKSLKSLQPETGKNVPETEVEYVIPFKNMYGLISYYIGIFSFIPFLGVILGITAIILGVIGLINANKAPRFVLFMLYYAQSMNSPI